MSYPLCVVSLGAGVQSSFLDIESRKGAFDFKPDVSIFADTGDEPEVVYRWLEELKKADGHPIVSVCQGCLMKDALHIARSKKSGMLYIKGLIPAYLRKPDGSKGLMGRKCTRDYKIQPIVKKCRELIGKDRLAAWRKKHRDALTALDDAKKAKVIQPMWAWNQVQDDALVRMQIGISVDEFDRMKPSQTPWIRSEWPLVEAGITRDDCRDSVKKSVGVEPPRSACRKCPFHSDHEWLKQKTESPQDFAESVAWERELQEACGNQEALIGTPFLHSSLVPLDQVQFDSGPSHSQLNLFRNECEGLCGV